MPPKKRDRGLCGRNVDGTGGTPIRFCASPLMTYTSISPLVEIRRSTTLWRKMLDQRGFKDLPAMIFVML